MRNEREEGSSEERAEYNRRLNTNHPLNRKQFLKDRLKDLKYLGLGGLTMLGGMLWYNLAETGWNQYIEEKCRTFYQQPNCQETDPQLFEDLKDASDNFYLVEAPGVVAALGGGFVATESLLRLGYFIVKRKIDLSKR